MAQSKRVRSWYVTIPLVGLTVAYTLLYFLPQKKQMTAQQKQIDGMRLVIAESASLAARINAANDELQEIRDYTQRWQARLPAAAGVQETFARIDQSVTTPGAKLTAFTPEPQVKQETLRRVPLKLVTRGSFEQTWQALNNLDALPELAWCERLDVQSVSEDGQSLQAEMDLVLFAGPAANAD